MINYNSCSSVTLGTIDARCDKAVGGIAEILIANRDDISAVTVDATSGTISNITMGNTAKFHRWQFRKNTSAYTSTMESDPAIGNCSVTTEVTLQFTKAEAQKRLEIQSAINAAAVVLVKDMNGQWIYLGYDNEVNITNATMVSGTANTDLNGFTLTFQDIARELPHFLAADFDPSTLL